MYNVEFYFDFEIYFYIALYLFPQLGRTRMCNQNYDISDQSE